MKDTKGSVKDELNALKQEIKVTAYKLTKVFNAFFESERTGGLILLGCTVLSLILANSSLGETYTAFWHHHIDASFGPVSLNYSTEHWINDGLMTIFFLLVGLEIEREIYVGELAEKKRALLPAIAALGGMAIPALFHYFFNAGTDTADGIGIPMATDIAFALGMMSLLGKRVPASLKIFVTALAIIDDVGAIAVIAIFYNKGIHWGFMGAAAGIFALLLLLNRLKVYKLVFYLVPGVIMWYCMLKSGIHATLAGVLLAFAIPFTGDHPDNISYKLQNWLHKPVAFLILPVFALANTGILLKDGWLQELSSSNGIGIITGLTLGKPIGIFLFSWILIKLGAARLPYNCTWWHLLGAGLLAGIGFTMAIFIANLAFPDGDLAQYSKVSVLCGSMISCILGMILLSVVRRPTVPADENGSS